MTRSLCRKDFTKVDVQNLLVFSYGALVMDQHQHAPSEVVTNAQNTEGCFKFREVPCEVGYGFAFYGLRAQFIGYWEN